MTDVSLFPFADYWWFYGAFTLFVLGMLALDLGVFHRRAHEVSPREALTWSLVWTSLALGFSAVLYMYCLRNFPMDQRLSGIPGARDGSLAWQTTLEFLSGFLIEKSLALDNIFVFVVIFQFFAIPSAYQHRILFFGILGALVFRVIFIALGTILLQYKAVAIIFGVLLVATGAKILFAPVKPIDPEANVVIRLLRRLLPVTPQPDGQNFFQRIAGTLHATPLLIALVFIEVSDIIFAVDSVPAIFAVTREPLMVFTSNVFAILGMRALYFLLAGVVQRFHLLKYALGTILVFVGLKMAWLNEAFGGKFPISWSLAIITFILIFFLLMSLTGSSRSASAGPGAVSGEKKLPNCKRFTAGLLVSIQKRVRPLTQRARSWIGFSAGLCLLSMAFSPCTASAQRTVVKPGWNMFSPEQDVEIGRSTAAAAERQLPMLNDARVDAYLNRLGRRLAEKAPGERYSYQFKAVNEKTINAFALPGGFLYVNRGLIEAADNEAQLAGVLGHEIGHVALRHGTNQASKSQVAQAPLAILGGVLGNDSVGSVLAQMGTGFALNSVLLKYSRDAERQADIVGTQLLYDSGYDPRAMSQFFEKLQAENKEGRPAEFFSSHPNPDNRAKRVSEEIARLGGAGATFASDSPEFSEIKRYVRSLPAPAPGQATAALPPPSDQLQTFANDRLEIQHPKNWSVYARGNAVTFAPEGGLQPDKQGNTQLGYGLMINEFGTSDTGGKNLLKDATRRLIEDLRRSNPGLTLTEQESRRLDGNRAISSQLAGNTPTGHERVWVVTVWTQDGLLYFACVAPEKEFAAYEPVFARMIDSVRFSDQVGDDHP